MNIGQTLRTLVLVQAWLLLEIEAINRCQDDMPLAGRGDQQPHQPGEDHAARRITLLLQPAPGAALILPNMVNGKQVRHNCHGHSPAR